MTHSRRISLGITFGLVLIGSLSWSIQHFMFGGTRLPYHDSFNSSDAREWVPYGGDWHLSDGTVMNRSDENGAKLVTGSSDWENYEVDADLKMIGHEGNVGIIVRVNDEEFGVDSYNGYYVGLRSSDSAVVMGRADHGWMGNRPAVMVGGVHTGSWYHFRVFAVGCHIAVEVTNLNTKASSVSAMDEKQCVQRGKIGLRSVATGGAWRNISVKPATEADLDAIRSRAPFIGSPIYPIREDEYARMMEAFVHSHATAGDDDLDPILGYTNIPDQTPTSIASLRSSLLRDTRVTLRGVVTLPEPLYMQDSTGGVSVRLDHPATLNAGDEIEIVGKLDDATSSAQFHASKVYLLGDRTLVVPVSITSTQAASGGFDGRLVEVRGRLHKKSTSGHQIILWMGDTEQSFLVTGHNALSTRRYESWEPESELRVRGICKVGPSRLANNGGFTLLLRSVNDVEVLSGPPWWTPRLIARYIVLLLSLAALFIYIYLRIVHWNMQVVIEERERLAYDMHDTLAQSFAGVGFHLQGLRNNIRVGSITLPTIIEKLDVACQMVARTHREASDEIAALHPDDNSGNDILTTLERSTHSMLEVDCPPLKLVREGFARPYSLTVRDAFFQIGREAIANAIRHSKSSLITLRLHYGHHRVTLEICDNGVGFDLPDFQDSLGIRSMRRRSLKAGAVLEIVSAIDKGTCVRIDAPYRRSLGIVAWLKNSLFRPNSAGRQ